MNCFTRSYSNIWFCEYTFSTFICHECSNILAKFTLSKQEWSRFPYQLVPYHYRYNDFKRLIIVHWDTLMKKKSYETWLYIQLVMISVTDLMISNFANQIFILYNIHFTLRIIPIAFSPLGNHMFFTSRLISLLNGRHSFRLW